MLGVARMDKSQVSSDDRVDAQCLANFYADGRLAMHCSRLTVMKFCELQGYGVLSVLSRRD